MDNPEKLETQGTQDEDKQDKLTTISVGHHLETHGTQDEDKQDKLTPISVGQHMVHKTKTNKTNSQQ